SERVKVVLTGEGSDELFGGYARYARHLSNSRAMKSWGLMPGPIRSGIRNALQTWPLFSASLRRKLGHTVIGRNDTLSSLLIDNFYAPFSQEQRDRLLLGTDGGACNRFFELWESRPDASPLQRMLYVDQKTYLVELLMKQDQMSMSASIESRVP